MLNLQDLRSGLDQVQKISALVDEACSLCDSGQPEPGRQKFQEALVICTNAQALLMLNLARLAIQSGDADLCESYCQTALEMLEMVGTETGVLGQTATAILAQLAAARPMPPFKRSSGKLKRR
jgi:hypothetical protein